MLKILVLGIADEIAPRFPPAARLAALAYGVRFTKQGIGYWLEDKT